MFAYLRLELARMSRNTKFYVLTMGLPVVLYLIFTNIGDAAGGQTNAAALYAMVAMVCYGALFAALSSANGLVEDRSTGWMRQLGVTPVPPSRAVAAKLVTSMIVVVPAIGAVCAAAVLDHGVHLAAGRWVLLVALMWVGAVPLALLGLAAGYLGTPQTSQLIGMATSLGLSLLGGLLFPVSQLPPFLRHVAHALPTYQYADMGWRVVGGHSPTATGVAILAAWMVGFAVLAALGYRRNGRAA